MHTPGYRSMLARRRRRHALGVGNGKAEVIPKPNKSPKKPAPKNNPRIAGHDSKSAASMAGAALFSCQIVIVECFEQREMAVTKWLKLPILPQTALRG